MNRQPFLFAVSGVKNSGKTTLITKLIPIFKKYGLRTATIKHDGHDFEADVQGTDTYAHLQAGAYGTAIFSKTKYMIVKQEAISEKQLITCFPKADIILLEGFKNSDYPKIELIRKGNSDMPVCANGSVVAVASDFCPENGSERDVPLLDLNNPEEIAEFILDYRFIRTKLSMVVLAGGMSSRMGRDKADLSYEGRTFLERQIEKGRKLGIKHILVSGYRGDKCKEVVVKDRYPNKGPLGGLEATLRKAETEHCLVMTVDVPLVTEEVLQLLIRDYRKAWMDGTGKAIRVVKHEDRTEPLIGIYRSNLAEMMKQAVNEGSGSVFRFLEKTGYDISESGASEEIFQNVNCPEIYEKIQNI